MPYYQPGEWCTSLAGSSPASTGRCARARQRGVAQRLRAHPAPQRPEGGAGAQQAQQQLTILLPALRARRLLSIKLFNTSMDIIYRALAFFSMGS